MNKMIPALLAGAIFVLFAVQPAMAQNDQMGNLAPIDVWTCSFNERRDAGDLDEWVAHFNRWSDQQEDDTYSAWTLTPSYYGPNQSWDFIWVGAWPDGTAMGRGWDLWNETNDGLMAEFQAMVSCDSHVNFAQVSYRVPENMDPSGTGVLAVTDCNMTDGASIDAVDAAMRRWTATMAEAGSETASFYWFPVYGGGDEDFDFKWVEAFADYSAWGADYDLWGNGEMAMRWQSEFGRLIDCDSARVYDYRARRIAGMQDDG